MERSAVNVDQRIPSFHSHSRNWSFMNVAVLPLFLSPLLRKPFLDFTDEIRGNVSSLSSYVSDR